MWDIRAQAIKQGGFQGDKQKGLGRLFIDIINAYQEVIEGAGLPFILYTGSIVINSFQKCLFIKCYAAIGNESGEMPGELKVKEYDLQNVV